ncbi:mycofactocin system FadH/OYE family oxidoreductase 2 [Pseudonocardia hydrocarbonoxydans]|uniref:Oxidoreductase n=1 Tax=Pseudonocardia hydrocarbonoxydans TaxID=76726 RepID=A0A4Y3WQT9_9PSEU|nr:mycofactocin system FadH/OYE family oxidoreductase 2 [Pseudonocardia hydrocarbonoxydans]GEC20858.1 oxidoreductase [Pseudonocardia hydrocarbonoxydans]
MLNDPIRLGSLTLRNRVVFPAHLTNFAEDGLPTAQHAAYYAARAAGGAGLVITEEHGVDPHDRPYEKLIHASDAALPGYRAITAAVHAHGAAVLAQLTHNGGQSSGMYSRRPVHAPSPVPDPLFREVPVELDAVGIARIVDGYAATAARCVAGGFDGVELQGAHSSLIRQFLSPATNRRADAHGRDRDRFLLDVVAAVRAAIGPDRVLGVRLCGDEGIEHGIGIDDAVATARRLRDTGTVDYLNTAIGVATSTLYLVEASLRFPPGYALSVPAAIRAAVDLPVVGVGRFTTPADAERALTQGHCDLVGVVRGQIAEPAFASAPVRACVGCNQECVGRVGRNRWLGCAVNPRAGRESVALPAPGVGRRVLVVGAGPGGLRAAATAAARGHRVELYERDDTTGGAVRLAAAAPGRAEFGRVVHDLLAECRAAGVEIRTGVDVDAALVERVAPDVVVLATGARARRPGWAVDGVVDVRDVLSGRLDAVTSPGDRVLVYDELGFHQAPAAAEWLAARGCTVEIMTPGMVVAQDLGTTLDMELFHRRAHAAGITLTTDRMVTGAVGGASAGPEVTVLHHTVGTVERRRYDLVVTVVPPTPDDALWAALRGGPRPVHRVGDCLAPRRVHAAVAEGDRVAVGL